VVGGLCETTDPWLPFLEEYWLHRTMSDLGWGCTRLAYSKSIHVTKEQIEATTNTLTTYSCSSGAAWVIDFTTLLHCLLRVDCHAEDPKGISGTNKHTRKNELYVTCEQNVTVGQNVTKWEYADFFTIRTKFHRGI
jgi:hypothetical protein